MVDFSSNMTLQQTCKKTFDCKFYDTILNDAFYILPDIFWAFVLMIFQ